MKQKRICIGFLLSFWASFAGTVGRAADLDWKGKPSASDLGVGAVTGLGIVNSSPGYVFLGTLSKKLLYSGFIPDINNPVSLEVLLGPVFLSNGASWLYSAHLRWDFVKDSIWTIFAVGGVGGASFSLTPRFGVGSFYRINESISLRGDISHDLIACGVHFSI